MGIQSQSRVGSIEKAKQSAYSARVNEKKNRKKLSTNILTGRVIPRVDEGTKVCKKCDRYKRTGKRDNKGHDPTCPKSRQYNKLTSIETKRVNKVASTNFLSNNKKLKGDEKGGTKVLTEAEVASFFEANPRSVVNSDEDDYNSYDADDDGDDDDDDDDNDNDDNDNDKINGNNSVNIDDDRKVPASDRKVPASLSDELLSADTIKREINARIISPQDYKGMKKATHIPIEVAAIFDYIISLLPTRYKTGTNKIMAGKRSLSRHQLQFYRKHFPPGHMGFLVPPSDKTQPPDLHYSILEGRRFFFV